MGTCNRCEQVQAAVDAALPTDGDAHHLIVIDAGSSDGTVDALRRKKVEIVEDGQKLGQSRSLNRIARTVTSPYLCWISDDNVLQPGALASAISILDKDASIGMVSLKVRDVTGSRVQKPYIGAISAAGFINCNQGVIRTDLFKKLGGFDEELSDYMIDTDLSAKVLLAGRDIVFTKDLAIKHFRDHEPESWITSDVRRQRLEKNRTIFEQRYSALIDWVDHTQDRHFLEKRLRQVGFQRKLHALLRKYHLVSYSWNDRDWYNLAFASTISLNDPLRHLFTSHYLRQSLPSDISLNARQSQAHQSARRRQIHVKRWNLASQLDEARKRGDTLVAKDLRLSLDEIDHSLSFSRS